MASWIRVMMTVTFAKAEVSPSPHPLVKEDLLKPLLISWRWKPSVTQEGCSTGSVYSTRCGSSF